jgi:hypothetical protein
MRSALLLACLLSSLLGLNACGPTTAAPTDPIAVRNLLQQELYQLQTGLERSDAILASAMIDDRFTMDNNVSARYRDTGWSGSGVATFRGFLNDVFNLQANISANLFLADVVIDGDLATASVSLDWHSQRTDTVPPGQFASLNHDYFFFRRRGAAWLLLRWQEVPTPPPPFDLP